MGIIQMNDSMFTVLDEATEKDYFSIIEFNHDVKFWNPLDGFSSKTPERYFKADADNKKMAISSVLELVADGGTNINEAILKAIEHGKEAKRSKKIPETAKSMIVFLTDGEASEGVQDSELIKQNIEDANKEADISIMTIGFGVGADFDLLKKISQSNNGIAKRIFEDADAALQLENFFTKISNPVLSNVKFDYVGAEVEEQSLSERQLGTWFQGSEYIIVGQLKKMKNVEDDVEVEDDGAITVTIDAEGAGGHYHQVFDICSRYLSEVSADYFAGVAFPSCHPTKTYPRSEAQQFLKKLFAFQTIKQLLKKIEISENEEYTKEMKARALKLSLDNNFVTKLTSLVVIKPNEEPIINNLEVDLSEIPNPQYSASSVRHSVSSFSSLRNKNRRKNPGALRPYSYSSYTTTTRRFFTTTTHRPLIFDYVAYDYENGPGAYVTTRLPSILYDSSDYEYDSDLLITGPGNTTNTTSTKVDDTCSGNLTLYSKTYLRGEEFEADLDVEDLGDFDDETVSVKIDGNCCWEVFSEKSFQGERLILTPWDTYTSATSLGNLLQNVSSLKKLYAC